MKCLVNAVMYACIFKGGRYEDNLSFIGVQILRQHAYLMEKDPCLETLDPELDTVTEWDFELFSYEGISREEE